MKTRFDPRVSARRGTLATIAVGSAVILVLVGAVLIGVRAPDTIPGRSYYTVTAGLKDANTLAGHSDVRIGGARVGQTLEPRFEGGRPVIDLQLDAKVRPILTDAEVRIRPKSAIGQPYVDLSPGTTGDAVPDGGRLSAERSRTAVPLDRVLATFDPPTRRRFQTALRELGAGVAGRGRGGGESLENGPAMLRDTAAVTRRLAAEPDAVRGFVRNGAEVADAFAEVRTQAADLLRPAARTMEAIATERAALARTLDAAPGTLEHVTSGLTRATPAVDELGRLARAATPALRLAPDALREASGLLRAAPASVPQVDRTLRLARNAVPPTLALLRSARATAPWLDGFMKGAEPTVDELAPRRCDIVRLARNWENMFAFGEPGQQGGTSLHLTITADGADSLGGTTPLSSAPNLPLPRSLYPGPCKSYDNAALLGSHGG